MNQNVSGSNNTAMGYGSLHLNLANYNTAIGYNSGASNTTGEGNIAIGDEADFGSGNLNNAIVIGANATVTTSNTIQLGNNSITKVVTSGTIKSNGLISNLASKTSAYTITNLDEIITADATSAAFTITLPTAVGVTGQTFTIKRINSGSNAVTVGATSSQTIDGSTTYSLSAQYKYVKVVSDGSNWIIAGNN